MIWVDYCILIVFILSVIIGLLRGFTREVLGLGTWLLAFGLAWLFGGVVADMLQRQIGDPAIRLGCAYALLFLGGLLVGSLVTTIVSEIVKHTALAPPDRIMGAGFGLIRAALFVAAFVLVAATMGAAKDRWWQQSLFVGKFEWLAQGLGTLVPERWLQALRPDPTSSS